MEGQRIHFQILDEATDFGEPPVDFDTADLYEERCENEVPVDEDHSQGLCYGRVVSTGGRRHYSNGYDCYTLFLNCENCGPYEVECV